MSQSLFLGTIPFSTIFYPVNQLVCYVLLNMNLIVCSQTLSPGHAPRVCPSFVCLWMQNVF